MLKTCLSCKKEKNIEEFPGRSTYTVEGIQRTRGKCKVCYNRDFRNRKKMTREEYLASVSKPTTNVKRKLYENLKPKPGQTMGDAKREAWNNWYINESGIPEKAKKEFRLEQKKLRESLTEKHCKRCGNTMPIEMFKRKRRIRKDESVYYSYGSCRSCTSIWRRIKRSCTSVAPVPNWLNSNQKQNINKKYKKCKDLVKQTGKPHHVDHIVPLHGEIVCGLHVPWNLRVIPEKENLRKTNKWKFGCMYQYDKVSHIKENTIDKR